MRTPAVVVLAYERPQALQRLLTSLREAFSPSGSQVPLVISLDRSTSSEGEATAAVATSFEWRFGPKRVLQHPEHLGVVGHFRRAGALTREYGDIVVLVDDLTVSPAFHEYASQVLDAYADDERIAGFCLYGLWFNGFTREPFLPLDDGGDVFFLRVPYTQGLCFSARQWEAFETWPSEGNIAAHPDLHPAFLRFGADEWFPSLAAYLARSGRYFCFPRTSLTVGWGDAGAHFQDTSSWFQAPLLLGRRVFQLPALEDCLAVYDGFFELLPARLRSLSTAFEGRDFDVDLNATKQRENLHTGHVLTTRPVRGAGARFGLTMYPPELNLARNVPGSNIALARVEDVRWDDWAEKEARRRLHDYFWRRHRPSRARALGFQAARAVEWLRQRSR